MAARAVQGPHQQDPQVFPERMVGQEPAQLGYDLGGPAAGQLRGDPQLGGVQAPLGQAFGLRVDERRRRDVGQRAAPPERERLGEQADRALRISGRKRAPTVMDQGVEDLEVAVRVAQAELIARSAGPQDAAVGVVHEMAQPVHVDADQVGRPGGRRVPPHLADQHVDRNDLPGPDQQDRQEGTPLRGSDLLPVLSGPDLKGPEQPEPHHYPGSLASG